MDCTAFAAQPVLFWKEALRKVCHSMGISMFRDKPLRTQFLRRLRAGLGVGGGRGGVREEAQEQTSRPNGWLQLKKDTKVYLDHGVLYVGNTSHIDVLV